MSAVSRSFVSHKFAVDALASWNSQRRVVYLNYPVFCKKRFTNPGVHEYQNSRQLFMADVAVFSVANELLELWIVNGEKLATEDGIAMFLNTTGNESVSVYEINAEWILCQEIATPSIVRLANLRKAAKDWSAIYKKHTN